MKIGVAIPTSGIMLRNNGRQLDDALRLILASTHVADVTISNDATTDYDLLTAFIYGRVSTAIRCQQNAVHLGEFGNVLASVQRASSEWVLVAQPETLFPLGYFARLMELHPWQENVAYIGGADLQSFVGEWTIENIGELRDKPGAELLCNAANWFVNRARFLSAFAGMVRTDFDDTLYWTINRTWLQSGGVLRVVDGLNYTPLQVTRSDVSACLAELGGEPVAATLPVAAPEPEEAIPVSPPVAAEAATDVLPEPPLRRRGRPRKQQPIQQTVT